MRSSFLMHFPWLWLSLWFCLSISSQPIYGQPIQGPRIDYNQPVDVDVQTFWRQTFSGAGFIGPIRFLFQTSDWSSADRLRLGLTTTAGRDQLLYNTGGNSLFSNTGPRRSGEVTANGIGTFDFQVSLFCAEVPFLQGQCNGRLRFTLVDCGCPEGYEVVTPCSDNAFGTAASAVCEQPPPVQVLSNATVLGRWVNVASGSQVSFTVTTGTETTEGQSLTTEQSQTAEVSVTAGISYQPPDVSGGIGFSSSITVTGSASATVASLVSSSITQSRTTSVSSDCIGESSTGFWFLYQWLLELPAQDGGIGFTTFTNHFACTETSLEPPLCPVGFCQGQNCQMCFEPYEDLPQQLRGTSTTNIAETGGPTMANPTMPPSSASRATCLVMGLHVVLHGIGAVLWW